MVATESIANGLPLDPFPERLDPVFVKDLRQGLRARRFVVPFLSVHALAVMLVATQFALRYFADQNEIAHGLGAFAGGLLDGGILLLLWVMVGFVMPLTGITALQAELAQERNVELLLMAGLSRWQIMRGKWLVLCALSGLIMVSMFPYMLTLYFAGAVELVSQTTQFAVLWIFNVVLSAMIVGASGFRHLVGRFMVIGIALGSYSFTAGISAVSLSIPTFGGSSAWMTLLGILNYLLVAILYSIYGLQLGRDRLRIYSHPLDPGIASGIIGILFFTPMLVSIGLILGPTGVFLVLCGLLVLIHAIARAEDGGSPLAP